MVVVAVAAAAARVGVGAGARVPVELRPRCVQCNDASTLCVQACYGDFTCGTTDQGLCWFADLCSPS